MTIFEAVRRFEKITPDVIRSVGIEAVLQNDEKVLLDSIRANDNEKTFSGTSIRRIKPFTDWSDSGEFHQRLQFIPDNKDIEFVSYGDGNDAITKAFSEDEYIAPHAKTLREQTKNDIQKSFIEIIKTKI